jgi:hypothetical protein
MKMKIEFYIEEVSSMLKNGESISLICEKLEKQMVPPGVAILILSKVLKLEHEKASSIIFNSEAYEKYGKLNDLFLDKLTKDDLDDEK